MNLVLFEYREIHTAVYPFFHKVRMCVEIVFLAMFQYKNPVFLQLAIVENQVGQCGQLGQFVGRVGKDEIKGLCIVL